MTVNTYHFKHVEFYQTPYEGRSRVCRFEPEEISKEMTFPKGSAVVKTSQNGVRLLMNLWNPKCKVRCSNGVSSTLYYSVLNILKFTKWNHSPSRCSSKTHSCKTSLTTGWHHSLKRKTITIRHYELVLRTIAVFRQKLYDLPDWNCTINNFTKKGMFFQTR